MTKIIRLKFNKNLPSTGQQQQQQQVVVVRPEIMISPLLEISRDTVARTATTTPTVTTATDTESKKQCCDGEQIKHGVSDEDSLNTTSSATRSLIRSMEKSVIVHKDENGFGLRVKGQAPIYVEHVHKNGAAWRAGVRRFDTISKVNGNPVARMSHKDVVLMFKACSRFVALTIHGGAASVAINPMEEATDSMTSINGYISPPPGGTARNLHSSGSFKVAPRASFQQSYAASESSMSRAGPTSVPAATQTSKTFNGTSELVLVEPHRIAETRSQPSGNSRLCRDPGTDFRDSQQQAISGGVGGGNSEEKLAAVCIFCRNLIPNQVLDKQAQTVTSCAQCQLKFLRGTTKKKLQHSQATTKQLQRLYGSSRDSNATTAVPNKPTPTTLAQILITSKETAAASKKGADKSLYKLSQSASTHSLTNEPTIKCASSGGGGAGSGGVTTVGSGSAIHRLRVDSTASAATNATSDRPKQNQLHPSPQPERRPTTNKRLEIIREFIDTERTHTERLRCLDELFYAPLKSGNMMTSEQLRAVFSCHRTLYKIHRQIYRILLSASYHNSSYTIFDEPLIGSALLEIFEGDLKRRLERAACSYCSAQASNQDLLNKLTRRDTKVGEFIAQVTSQRMIGRLGIKDLLASCFQRLTKYPLLLENLLKATPQKPPPDDDDIEEGEDYECKQMAVRRHHRRHRSSRNSTDSDGETSVLEGGGSGWLLGGDVASSGGGGGCFAEEDDDDDEEDEDERHELRLAAELARRNSRRMLAIGLAEEREFIGRALVQSRQILVHVNESIKVAMSHEKLKQIWKRTEKHPSVPLIDISEQQVLHEGPLTLRLSKRSFEVYVLLLNDYLIILTREGQDKYRLKYFTPEGKGSAAASSAALVAAAVGSSSSSTSNCASSTASAYALTSTASAAANNNTSAGFPPIGASFLSSASSGAPGTTATNSAPLITTSAIGSVGGGSGGGGGQTGNFATGVYSPVFVIDEHLTTRDAATDENGFYLLCKRKDDSRIYEFAARSPADRAKWRDRIQTSIERQTSNNTAHGSEQNNVGPNFHNTNRRASCESSTTTKSSSELSTKRDVDEDDALGFGIQSSIASAAAAAKQQRLASQNNPATTQAENDNNSKNSKGPPYEPTKIVGTISYVEDDEIVMPSKMESTRVFVDQAIQVHILNGPQVVGPQQVISSSG